MPWRPWNLQFHGCRTVALRKKKLLTNRRATVPPIVKIVYLLRTKSCARFGLNFSICLLCQVKIPDEINTRHVYLLGKNTNKPLVHFYWPLSAWNSPANVVDKFELDSNWRIYRLHLLENFRPTVANSTLAQNPLPLGSWQFIFWNPLSLSSLLYTQLL